MNTELIISLILGGVFDAIRDSILHYNSLQVIDDTINKIFNFFGIKHTFKWFGSSAWENKYKVKPVWLWSTLFVFLTDSWHFFKYLTMFCLFNSLSIALGHNDLDRLVYCAICAALYMIPFELTHKKL